MGKSLIAKLGGVGIAIIVAVVFYFVQNKGQEKIAEANAPEVGQCLSVTGTINAKHEEQKCADLAATYKVTADNGDCDENETTYKISLGSGNSANVADLCLALNANEGDCLSLGASTEEKVDCAATKGTSLKVASVGKSGDTCASPGQPLEYTKRDLLYCLVENA
ncbi:hypothetical protein ASE01_06370 [Nocardioides sp. Root190]|uniref:LppU/SCO3897 family protein n=1 Tax=Nocardioides sp. Root190 TaxID=1736488 RepID=UPI0006FA0E7D|nr:hypothetical protein [Nocardioides sp. Root190]KRB77815.1 hypothetical protein ASE01_06370 [Nocardioides sp. Root190]